jgi:uncharacterized membrane protein required for colicin V production
LKIREGRLKGDFPLTLINIIAAIILFFSFIGGLTQGAIKSFFSLLGFIIAIPAAGRFYPFFANLLSFIPSTNWRNFAAFFITLGLAGLVLSFIFYFPRKITEESWEDGALFHLMGGVINLLGAAIGILILALVLSVYPVWDWLQQAMENSLIIQWLANNLTFVQSLLPETLRTPLPRA